MKPDAQRIIMYIGITIGVLGGLLGMAVAIAAAPLFGSIFSLFFILIFGFVFGGLYLRGRKRKELLQNGTQANGKIIELWDTAVTINNQPQIGMKIQYNTISGQTVVAELKMVISRLETAYYQPGVSCVIRYDPNNTSKIAIESIGGSAGNQGGSFDNYSNYGNQQSISPETASVLSPIFNGMTQPQIDSWLVNMDNENQRIMQSGTECKAIIKNIEWMGVYVNGQNKLKSVTLEVLPDNLPAYEAKCYGIVAAASEGKYQPGKQIWVKYDKFDKSKVTVSHS
jgi:hypothetical protein